MGSTSRVIGGHRYYRTGTLRSNMKVLQTEAKLARKYGRLVRILPAPHLSGYPKSMKFYQLWITV